MRRPQRLSFALVAVALVAVGCGNPPDASGYDDPLAREHFLSTCTVDTTIDTSEGVEEGTTREAELAPAETCECVFDSIQDTFPLSWDDLRAYEDEVDAADEGEVPEPPEELVKAVEQCTTQGPIAPSSDEPDAGSN